MSALIKSIIPTSNGELIRDRIAAILAVELTYQGILNNDYEVPSIFVERAVQFSPPQLPCVNISLQKGDYSLNNQRYLTAEYTYTIDIFYKSESTTNEDGDTLSAISMTRTLQMAMLILKNPAYTNLLFENKAVTSTAVTNFFIEKNISQPDAENNVAGRIIFTAKAIEHYNLIDNNLWAQEVTTTVTLFDTAKGYFEDYVSQLETEENDTLITQDGQPIITNKLG